MKSWIVFAQDDHPVRTPCWSVPVRRKYQLWFKHAGTSSVMKTEKTKQHTWLVPVSSSCPPGSQRCVWEQLLSFQLVCQPASRDGVPEVLPPCKSGTQQTQSLASSCRTLQNPISFLGTRNQTHSFYRIYFLYCTSTPKRKRTVGTSSNRGSVSYTVSCHSLVASASDFCGR